MPLNNLAPAPLNSLLGTYQKYIGDPFAAVVGGGVRGLLGFSAPEYGGALGQEAYRTGQAIGVMPMVAAPVGLARGLTKVPVMAERLAKEQKYYGKPMQNASEGILTYMPPEKFLSLATTGSDVQKRAAELKSFDVKKFNEEYLPYLKDRNLRDQDIVLLPWCAAECGLRYSRYIWIRCM